MKKFCIQVACLLLAAGLGCGKAPKQDTVSPQKSKIVKSTSAENLFRKAEVQPLLAPVTSSAKPLVPTEIKSTASLPNPPSQFPAKGAPEFLVKENTPLAIEGTRPVVGDNKELPIARPPSVPAYFSASATGADSGFAQNNATFESNAKTGVIGTSSSLLSALSLGAIPRFSLPASSVASLPRVATPLGENTNSVSSSAPPAPVSGSPAPAPRILKGGMPLPEGKGVPISAEGGGAVLALNHPGGVVSAPPMPGLIAPMSNLQFLRFSGETEESPSLQVALKALGGDSNKLPAGTVLMKNRSTEQIYPCEADCQGYSLRVVYFDQWTGFSLHTSSRPWILRTNSGPIPSSSLAWWGARPSIGISP